jgi:hypothetical protein
MDAVPYMIFGVADYPMQWWVEDGEVGLDQCFFFQICELAGLAIMHKRT